MQRVVSIRQPQVASQQDSVETMLSALKQLVGRLFGCWHRRMSWPITRDGQTYRACLKCGVRRSFDTQDVENFWFLLSP